MWSVCVYVSWCVCVGHVTCVNVGHAALLKVNFTTMRIIKIQYTIYGSSLHSRL